MAQVQKGKFRLKCICVKHQAYWAHHFRPYSAVHLCVVLSFALFAAIVIAMRRCDAVAEVQPKRRLMDKAVGWIGLAAALFVQTVTLCASRFSVQTALPLHICDIVMFVAPAALILRLRTASHDRLLLGIGLILIKLYLSRPPVWAG